jgi:hypothetical protein
MSQVNAEIVYLQFAILIYEGTGGTDHGLLPAQAPAPDIANKSDVKSTALQPIFAEKPGQPLTKIRVGHQTLSNRCGQTAPACPRHKHFHFRQHITNLEFIELHHRSICSCSEWHPSPPCSFHPVLLFKVKKQYLITKARKDKNTKTDKISSLSF